MYGTNLLGTAMGALLFLVLIEPLGAYRFLYLLLTGAALVGLGNKPSHPILRNTLRLEALLSGLGICLPHLYFFPSVDPSKNIAPLYPKEVLDTRWTPLFRVDICKTKFGALITMDGDAQTWVYSVDENILASKGPYVPDPSQVSRHVAFQLIPEDRRKQALIIGTGGGMDVLAAHQAGFKEIDAVDIDRVRIDWLKGKYAHLNAGLYSLPHVHTYATDGRSYVRDTPKRYEVISLYNVDSLTGFTLGAYNLVENYLYTKEAMREYFSHLKENGVLQITRPRWSGSDNTELYRLFNTMLEVLVENGLPPEEHLLITQHTYERDFILSKRSLLPPDRIESVLNLYERFKKGPWSKQGETGVFYPFPAGTPNEAISHNLRLLVEAAYQDQLEKIYEQHPNDIRPVTDDRPYFFENRKWAKVLSDPSLLFDPAGMTLYNNLSGTILMLSLVVSAMVILLLGAYTYWGTADRPSLGTSLMAGSYFAAIGFGYMLVQVTLIQRLSLILGHPIYSMALIVPTLLVSMGLSSMGMSHRWFTQTSARLVVLALPAIVVSVYQTPVLPLLETVSAGQTTRIVLVGLSLIPVGFTLGCCFPLGLRLFRTSQGTIIPIAWMANGGGSVLGSIAALGISLAFGYHTTIASACLCYAVAFLLALGCLALSTTTHPPEPWRP
jgi:hypothetical protein